MGVDFYELDNGMDFVGHQDPSATQFHLLFGTKMGTEKEDARRIEGAHLLEHMFFRSTSLPETARLVTDLEQRGIQSTGEIDFGHVYGLFHGPTRQMRHIVDTCYNALCNEQYDADEFEGEKLIIEIERRHLLSDVTTRMDNNTYRHMYPGTRYALPISAFIQNVRKLTPTDVLRLKRQLFRPSNMTVVAVGTPHPDDMYHAVNARFGRYPRRPGIKRYVPKLPAAAPFFAQYDDRGIDVSMVRHVLRAGDAHGEEAKDRMAELSLLESVLTEGDTSHLYWNLRLHGMRTYTPSAGVSDTVPEMYLFIDYPCLEHMVESNVADVTRIMEHLASHRMTRDDLRKHSRFASRTFSDKMTDDEELVKWYLLNSASGVTMSPADFRRRLREVTPERLRSIAADLAPVMGTVVHHPAGGPIATPRQPAFGKSSSGEGSAGAQGAPGSDTSSSPDDTILKAT